MKIIRRILKAAVLGALLGCLYAFISFILLTNVLQNNPAALFFFSMQGFLLGAFFSTLSIAFNRFRGQTWMTRITSLIIGAISGALSSIFNIGVTIYNSLIAPSFIVPPDIRSSIIRQLVFFFVGSLLSGIIIGFLAQTGKDE